MGLFGRMFGNRSANGESAAPVKHDREDVQTLMRDATEQFQGGNWDDAKSALERVLSLDPEQAEALYLLAGIEVGRGEAETGVELVRKALAIAPGNPNYHFSLGEVLTRLGRFDEAIPHLREAVERRPGVSILSNLGLPDLLVARNEDDYIAKAVALIRQPTLLAELRTTLRSRLLSAPNCDAAAFTRDLEQAYLEMLKVKAQ